MDPNMQEAPRTSIREKRPKEKAKTKEIMKRKANASTGSKAIVSTVILAASSTQDLQAKVDNLPQEQKRKRKLTEDLLPRRQRLMHKLRPPQPRITKKQGERNL